MQIIGNLDNRDKQVDSSGLTYSREEAFLAVVWWARLLWEECEIPGCKVLDPTISLSSQSRLPLQQRTFVYLLIQMRQVHHLISHITANKSYSILILKGIVSSLCLIASWADDLMLDTTIELSDPDDRSLANVTRLVSEFSFNGKVVDTIRLLADESSSGGWAADRLLVL
jgi:hypothetical protein